MPTKSRRPGGRDLARIRIILEELQDHLEGMKRQWGGTSNLSQEDFDQIKQDIQQMDHLVFKAYRAGLRDHPIVKSWIENLCLLGQKERLRKARTGRKRYGLEREAKKTFSPSEVELYDAIYRRLEAGESLETIRSALIHEKRLSPVTPRGFNKLVRRLFEMKPRDSIPALKERLRRKREWDQKISKLGLKVKPPTFWQPEEESTS